MTQQTLQETEKLVALVMVLQGERDKALAELVITRAERDQMGVILAQVESNVAETLGTTELSPETTDKELSQELDECRKALQEMKAELDQTKEDLARADYKLRGQAAKIRQQSAQPAGKD